MYGVCLTDAQREELLQRAPTPGGVRRLSDLERVILLAVITLGMAVSIRLPVAADLPIAPSPTGRAPVLLWTPQRQAIWNRMRAEVSPWWQVLLSNAERSGTPDAEDTDWGKWGTLAYQITGDVRFAAKAMQMIRPFFAKNRVSNDFRREYLAEFVVMYDWLSPALSQADRHEFITMLNRWCDQATSDPDRPKFPVSLEDSDQTIGDYFGFAFLALATAQENPRAAEFLNRSYVGGLTATGANRASMRNAIRQYVAEMAVGGQWIEGTQYNIGTLRILLMGAEGVRTATGEDHFPEITRFLREAAIDQIAEVSPDLATTYQWGDNEWPRNPLLFERVTLAGMLAGLTQGDRMVGPFIQRLVEEFAAKYGHKQTEVGSRFFYLYNPYAPQADWRAVLPKGQYAAGQGLLLFHDGWNEDSTFLGIHMPRRQPYVDHQVRYFGDFQLYRKREWALTHPLGYDGPPVTGLGTNAMLLSGLSSMAEFKGAVAQEFGPQEEYAYLAGTTGGQFYEPDRWDPPATFVHEWTRSIFYLPSSDKRSDTLVIFDRTNVASPTDLAKYDEEHQQMIHGATALKQWILHSPVKPTLTPEAITWTTAGGQQVRATTLLPQFARREVVDEDAAWPDDYPFPAKSEQKWYTRITPAVPQPWDTFLNVVQVYDAGTALSNTSVHSALGEVEGVLVQRQGHPDVLTLFNAKPGPALPQPTIDHDTGTSVYNPDATRILRGVRLLSSGYAVNWSSGTERTELYLLDLDPTRSWTARVDGGTASPLSVSSQGLGHLTVSGSGDHSLLLSASESGSR